MRLRVHKTSPRKRKKSKKKGKRKKSKGGISINPFLNKKERKKRDQQILKLFNKGKAIFKIIAS